MTKKYKLKKQIEKMTPPPKIRPFLGGVRSTIRSIQKRFVHKMSIKNLALGILQLSFWSHKGKFCSSCNRVTLLHGPTMSYWWFEPIMRKNCFFRDLCHFHVKFSCINVVNITHICTQSEILTLLSAVED